MKLAIVPTISAMAILMTSCQAGSSNANAAGTPGNEIQPTDDKPFNIEEIGEFNEPWAMTFLPDGKSALITEKEGKLIHWKMDGSKREIAGVPAVDYGGQGGFGDVVLSPNFKNDSLVYLSWAEAGEGNTRGAVVGMAKLDLDADQPKLEDLKIIWTQYPKVTGRGHYGHRIAFSPDGKYLFIASGERQKFDPAQDMHSSMGKVLRLYPDGSIPADNPFVATDAEYEKRDDKPSPQMRRAMREIWSLGHRNPLGLTFDDKGNLWNQEMGPRHGDEINLVKPKGNYGYPKVSNGNHYDGRDIPDHSDGDGFDPPKTWWNPAISPGGLMYYTGDIFADWKGSLFLGGLGSESLVRVKVNGTDLKKANQWNMGARIREVEQGPDGAIWILEDGKNGRLLKLTPKK